MTKSHYVARPSRRFGALISGAEWIPGRAGAARRVDLPLAGGHPWSFAKTDLDTLLTALFVLIDDHVIEHGQRRPGHPKRLSDAELACLAVATVMLGARSEHYWLRMCYGRLAHLFPYHRWRRWLRSAGIVQVPSAGAPGVRPHSAHEPS